MRDAAVKEWTRRPRFIFYTYGTQCTGGGEAKVTTRKKKTKKEALLYQLFLCVFVGVCGSVSFFWVFFIQRERSMKSLTGRGAYETDKNTACLTAVYNTIQYII